MKRCLPDKIVKDRFHVIRKFVEDRKVLDLGVVDSWIAKGLSRSRIENETNLLFKQIAEINQDVLGIDQDKEGIETLREQGYNVQCADVQTMDLGRRFDTIICCEIIEHLENPGRFLVNIKKHLTEEGVLLITTPNPFYVKQRYKIWRYNLPQVHDDHTCWFDPITLGQLLRLSGFESFEACWLQPENQFFKTWPRLLRSYFSHSFLMLSRIANKES